VLERERPLRSWTAAKEQEWYRETTSAPRALIIGAGKVGHDLARSLEENGRYQVVGFVDDEFESDLDGGWPVLGGREITAALVQSHRVDEVFLAYAPSWQQRLMEDLIVNHPEVKVRVVPSPYETLMRFDRIENMGDVVVVRLSENVARPWDLFKRTFDFTISLISLIVLSPIMLLLTAAIRASSPGNAIFRQERVGQGGKTFTLYKFRTMVQDAEAQSGPVLSTGDGDERLTSMGRFLKKTRMDELPQLWNILRGEMSLVGPRPERPFFVNQFEQLRPLYTKRHQVRPGLTGLAQVCGDYHTDARDKLRFDLIYVSQRSLWLDVWIMLRTVLVVFESRDEE
jgi:exopolysaccharide biosynthesis polyprenyl glycosylphosphotransferase